MPADFFPKRESEILDWSRNFSAKINSSQVYGVSQAMAREYATLQETFASLYIASQDNGRRTPSIIAAKNTARIALEKETRLLVRIVRGQNCSAQQRIELGVPLRNPGGQRGRHWTQSFPEGSEFAPHLGVMEVKALRVRLRLRDRMSPMNLSFPKGVMGATSFYATGDLPPALDDPDGWKFLCNTSRTVFDVAFEGRPRLAVVGGRVKPAPALPSFSKVWLSAFWMNGRGQRSASCEPVYTHLGYGLALAA